MSLDDSLKLERYKLVTDRQKYFTELARSSFAEYMKVFTGLAAGAIVLVSAKSKLDLKPEHARLLIIAIAGLVTLLGVLAIGQIVFCLVRWYGYRRAENEVNENAPLIKSWFWVFEVLYCVAIGLSILAGWIVSFLVFMPIVASGG